MPPFASRGLVHGEELVLPEVERRVGVEGDLATTALSRLTRVRKPKTGNAMIAPSRENAHPLLHPRGRRAECPRRGSPEGGLDPCTAEAGRI